MLKKVLMLSILSLVIGVGSVQAGWVRDGVAQNFMSLNRHVSTRLGVWHWGQPTTYTCGATTISMQMAWELTCPRCLYHL
ncbi:MAG: hypothetical protein QF535_18195 [Anaerolineales bacterium]|nr:hypothetical protein [Anaerolineales bacterium]